MSGTRGKRPEGNGSFLRALQDNFGSFSRSRKAIARYLIDHIDEAPLLSAQELARKTSTTSSTVVRFAQNLGFAGYTEMMKTAWREHRLSGAAGAGDGKQLNFPVDDDFSGRAVRTDILILEETMRKNSAESFLEAVTLLEKAEAIYLAGLFEAALVTDYLHYYLAIMGLPVVAVTDNSEASVAAAAGLGEGSVLVAIGFKTGHQFLLRLVKAAREQGAGSIGISDNELSEIARITEHRLYCYQDSTSFAPSLVGAFSLANALVSALYARNRHACDAHIARMKRLPLSSDWLV